MGSEVAAAGGCIPAHTVWSLGEQIEFRTACRNGGFQALRSRAAKQVACRIVFRTGSLSPASSRLEGLEAPAAPFCACSSLAIGDYKVCKPDRSGTDEAGSASYTQDARRPSPQSGSPASPVAGRLPSGLSACRSGSWSRNGSEASWGNCRACCQSPGRQRL